MFFEKLLKEINWIFCIKLCGVIGIYKKEVLSPPLSKQIPIERKNGSFYNNNPTHPTD